VDLFRSAHSLRVLFGGAHSLMLLRDAHSLMDLFIKSS
jgi:hypothetical protein